MVQSVERRRETHDEAVCRLADQAAQRGVQVFRTPDGRHYATSISQPGELHYVTGHSCDCRGFAHHQRCTHHSALLAHVGWLPQSPMPPAPAVVRVAEERCHSCEGARWIYAENRIGRIERMTCWTCDGTGVEPATLAAWPLTGSGRTWPLPSHHTREEHRPCQA